MLRVVRAAREHLGQYRSDHPWTHGQIKSAVGGLLIADGLVGLESPTDGRKTRPRVLGGLLLLAIGAVITGIGLSMGAGGIETDSTTTGSVSSVSGYRAHNGERTCQLRARFSVAGETYRTKTESASSGNCAKHRGDQVEIDFLESDPSVAQVHQNLAPGVYQGAFTGIGTLLGLIGVVMFVIRVASIGYGLLLVRQGRQLVARYPASEANAGAVEVVSEAKDRFLSVLIRRRADPRVD